jgi:phage terminase large subunit-like protein
MFGWERKDRRVVTDVTILQPPVDESDIVVGLLRLQAKHPDMIGIVFDPNAGGQQMAQLLEKGEHPLQYDDEARAKKGLAPLDGEKLPPLNFINHSQDNAPMALAAVRLDEAIRNGWLVVCDHPELRRHFLNAVERSLSGEKWKYDRPSNQLGEGRRKYPIDCLTGVLFAHSTAVGDLEETEDEGPPPEDLLNYEVEMV